MFPFPCETREDRAVVRQALAELRTASLADTALLNQWWREPSLRTVLQDTKVQRWDLWYTTAKGWNSGKSCVRTLAEDQQATHGMAPVSVTPCSVSLLFVRAWPSPST